MTHRKYDDHISVSYDLHTPNGWPDGSQPRKSSIFVYPGDEAWNRVTMSFNPSDMREVTAIKALSAGLMQHMKMLRDRATTEGKPTEAGCLESAMTHLEIAQMFGVKALFIKEPTGDE